jgi:hypothetical protein
MKSQDIYNAWKQQKSHIEITDSFEDNLMKRIHQYEQNKPKPIFDFQPLIDFISARPLAQAALIIAAAITGLARVAFMVGVVLI